MLGPIVLAILVVTGVTVAEDDAPVAGGLLGGRLQGIAEPRLATNILRIYQLEKQVERLRSKITEAEAVDPEKFLDELDARITSLEDDHCEKKEFQCGISHECINDLFVCDGHKDCHNGADEDEDTCDSGPVSAGNVFSGLTHWHSCIVREDHVSTLKIIGTKKVKFFSARVGVQAIATAEYEDSDGHKVVKSFNMKGGYNYATRRLVLFPTDPSKLDHRLGLRCNFNHGDDERAVCQTITFATLHVCADLHLTLEHHE